MKSQNLITTTGLALLFSTGALAAPTVTSIAPSAGPTGGGTPVTVTGAGFLPGATVKIGNVGCTQVKVVSSTTVICVSGAHSAGVRSVIVSNPGNDSNATNSLYTYNSTTDLTKTTKTDFEAAGSTRTNLTTIGLDTTLRWTDWTPATGGSMAAGTYYYVVTATNAAGETRCSVQSAGTTLSGGNNAINLNWTPISGALQYKLYRTTTSGTYTSPALMATLDTVGYKDVSASSSTGAPPSSNGATGDMFLAYGTTPATTFTSGPATMANVDEHGFSLQRPNGSFLVVHANTTATTSIYDPTSNSMSAGPNLTGNARWGAHGLKRPDGNFLIIRGSGTATSIYDPVANTMTAGPATTSTVERGGHALKRPDGKFLIVHGSNSTSTSIYDPVANTMTAGPVLTGSARLGAHNFQRPDGKFLIVHGSATTGTTVYDGSTNTMSAGPATTAAVSDGGQAIQRPAGLFLILHGAATSTSLYDPVANTMIAGPATTTTIAVGAHSIQRADGTFLIFAGSSSSTVIYDPAANTMSAGPSLAVSVAGGGHSFQRPDGQYLLIHGGGATNTTLYNAGWFRKGSYVSEKLNPADINFWNTFSWVRDLDDTVTTKIKTATSSAGLDATSWRTVANGEFINPEAGETWLQIGADYARAIPKSPGVLEDVWCRWLADFRTWAVPDVLSFTANYTSTSATQLSVSPSKAIFAYPGIQPTNMWLNPDSSYLRNDGTATEMLLGKISTFTAGANTWALSPTANGADQIRAQWSTTANSGPWSDIAAYNQNFTITTSVAVSDSVKFFFRIQSPTSTSSGSQYSSNLTVTAQ